MELANQDMASSMTIKQQAPFLFLDLPAEVRNMIYYHALGNCTIHAGQVWPLKYIDSSHLHLKSIRPFIGFLLSCKQIHMEASYILYKYGHVHIYIAASHFPIKDVELPLGKRYERHLDLVRTLHIEIRLPDCYTFFHPPQPRILPPSELRRLCDAVANLRGVRTLKLRWGPPQGGLLEQWVQERPRARKQYLCSLLQPFVWLQAKVPELRIEIETRRRISWYRGDLRVSWDSSMGLEDYMAKEFADVSEIQDSEVSS